jgi:hypothetical protein
MTEPTMNRRTALLSFLGLGAAAIAILAAGPATACVPRPLVEDAMTAHSPIRRGVSVTLEDQWGNPLPAWHHRGARWIAGTEGERYQVRISNHSARRIEAVVTVDGRDVLSGQVGNYRKQRGYVIDPYGSVVVDGFRQSMSHVAAFRFTGIENAYSTRMGTPQHVGVVGVAVFEEKAAPPPPRPRPRPVQPDDDYVQYEPPRPYYEESPAPARDSRSLGDLGGAEQSAPATEAPMGGAGRGAKSPSRPADAYDGEAYRDYDEGYARESKKLGTEYGETRYSAVEEVSFRRKNNRRADAIFTMYYDSYDNLRARGVPVDPEPWTPPPSDPDPFPDSRFAPPPPRRY